MWGCMEPPGHSWGTVGAERKKPKRSAEGLEVPACSTNTATKSSVKGWRDNSGAWCYKHQMLPMIFSLRKCRETSWVCKPSQQLARAESVESKKRAKDWLESKESSSTIQERLPKMAFPASLLPAMHQPKPILGCGGGKAKPGFVRVRLPLAVSGEAGAHQAVWLAMATQACPSPLFGQFPTTTLCGHTLGEDGCCRYKCDGAKCRGCTSDTSTTSDTAQSGCVNAGSFLLAVILGADADRTSRLRNLHRTSNTKAVDAMHQARMHVKQSTQAQSETQGA